MVPCLWSLSVYPTGNLPQAFSGKRQTYLRLEHAPEKPVREAVSYRGLFTAGWFDVREKHCFRLKIYDRLRASEQLPKRLRLCPSDFI